MLVHPGIRPLKIETARIADGRGDYLICSIKLRDWRNRSRSCRRFSRASRVYRPCLRALLLTSGAPDPGAPPCIRQRFLPATAGDRHGLPERVLAPHRALANFGAVLRR